MEDMPLVIFTILSQIVVGGFITLWWLERRNNNITRATGMIISLSLLGIGGISLLVSLLHLGQPFAAYRAIFNLGESWLSREILFYGLFMGVALIYLWFWYKAEPAKRHLTGAITGIFGILAIYSSAKIYMIPAIPAWNSMMTIFLFFLTSVILGPLYVGLLLSIRKELFVNMTKFSVVALTLAAAVTAAYLSTLFGGLPEAVQSAELMLNDGLFWIRISTFLLAFGLLFSAFKNIRLRGPLVYTSAFVILLVSEFFARLQFYLTAVHL